MPRIPTLDLLSARPIWLAAAIIACIVVFSRVNLAREADEAAALREQQVITNGIANLIDETSRAAIPQTIWDEAVANLDNVYDPEWANDNIGAYFTQTEGFEAALVLAGNDELLYAMRDGTTSDTAGAADLLARAQNLIQNVREQEARRGPLEPLIANGATMSSPLLATDVTKLGEIPFILTAIVVQPDFGEAMPSGPRAPIVITAEAIDEDLIARLSRQFLLTDGHLHQGGRIEANRATSQIMDASGRVVATLDWAPPRPGTAMLKRTLPVVLVGLLAFAALVAWLYRRSLRATQNLVTSEARASHLAYHDALTGLPNRLLLADRLEHALDGLRREGKPFAVHCIDLDHFKEINDTYGHGAGDDLVRAVSRLLQERCGASDTLARLGGDEFAIIQTEATRDTAQAMAGGIVDVLTSPVDISIGRVFIGCSIGVAIVSESGIEGAECLRQADLALYRAKAEGRGCFVFFESDMDAALRTRLEIRDELRVALKADQLRLVYQPQVHDGRVYGVEALLRWTHPQRGAISPAVFVPIAEEGGLIDALGAFTLRRAFEDSKQLPGLRIAVNVSAAQLRLKDFVPHLKDLAAQTQVETHRIELEITEGILLGDDAGIRERLDQIRALGFRIALDDFGTGYSSLSYLQRYPIDKIKIDRSFIANLGAEANADAVVGAIVRLARALRLDVIAEGVETEVQRVRLAAAGCGDIQGYLFGRPMPLNSLLDSLSAAPGEEETPLVARA